MCGKPRLLTKSDVSDIVNELSTKNGLSFGRYMIAEKIRKSQESGIKSSGRVPLTTLDYQPKVNTINSYASLIASQAGVSINNTTISKTYGRYTAENSLISAMALLCVIAWTHFVPVLEMNSQMYHELKVAPEGVKLLFDLVSKVHNDAPLTIVYTELIFPTDDTIQYIFEGKGEKKDRFSLVSSKSQKQSGTRAKYELSTSNHMMGMRVKLTYTFSAAGVIAPIFITVTGLSERELPKDYSCTTYSHAGESSMAYRCTFSK